MAFDDADERSEGVFAETIHSVIGYQLRRAQLSVFHRFSVAFDHLDLRPAEYSTLVLIAENPGRKQTEIADALQIKRANFVALVTRLADRGLILREQSATDRRANALYLTDCGKQFLAGAIRVQDELEHELVQMLGGDAARGQLLDLLQRLSR